MTGSQWVRLLLMFCCLAVLLLVALPDEAWAAPGGQFAKQLFRTPAGKIIGGIVLALLAFVLLPLILYVYVREAIAVSRTKKDLARLATRYPYFAWAVIDKQVREAVREIYAVWTSGDLSSVRHLMTEDYYASQQDMLDRWAEDGRRNVVELKNINRTRPLAVRVEDPDSASWVRVVVDTRVLDYLEQTMTKTVLKGKNTVQASFETIWWMVYDNGRWLVHAIEPGDGSLAWASHQNQVDTAYLDQVQAGRPVEPAREMTAPRRTASQPAAKQSSQGHPATQREEPSVGVPQHDDGQRDPDHP